MSNSPSPSSSAASSSPHVTPAVTWTWVPIRSLGPRHRERIAAHLTALGERDRYLRFGYPATDAQLGKYVDMLDFDHDEVFGIFNRRLELIAMAHLAHATTPSPSKAPVSEFGVSVLPTARGRGFGRRLFEHAMLHARNRGVQTLLIHALSENIAMLKIARNAGATIDRMGPESEALVKLPPDTLGSHMGEMLEQHAAEFDYRFKRHARQMNSLMNGFAEVRAAVGNAAPVAKE